MNNLPYLPFALLAYSFNAIAVLIDKFLLTKSIGHPLSYIFFISVFSFTSLALIPFVPIPSFLAFALASTSTLLWTTGAYFMFVALRTGQASRVIPIIGATIPLLLLGEGLVRGTLVYSQIWAIILLVFGLIAITFSYWKGKFSKKELIFELLSASFFAISYLVLKESYSHTHFLTVLSWSRIILIPLAIILLVIPKTHQIILQKNGSGPKFKFLSKNGILFFIGQATGGTSELLLTFSIALASPALVNSLQGFQYMIIFISTLYLARKFPQIYTEGFSKSELIEKVLGVLLIVTGIYLLSV